MQWLGSGGDECKSAQSCTIIALDINGDGVFDENGGTVMKMEQR